jgi:hypothetical protein
VAGHLLGCPDNIRCDPIWDAQLFEWTQDAINKGYRGQLREEFQILTLVKDGLLTGPGGAPFASSKFSINCPIVQRLNYPSLVPAAGLHSSSGHICWLDSGLHLSEFNESKLG